MTELAQFSAEFVGIGDLLERQAARYRRAHGLGQGGSMTTELARELLASIQCTLALSPEAHGSLDRRLSDGQAVLLAKLEAARKRLALAAATAPDWQSEGREEEFSALENYLRRYDLYCLAHHVPEITVYPYLAPLPEDALGLDRAAGRLEMLWAENQIFALLPESRLEPFWDAFCGRDLGLTENPCGAVLCHAAAAAALGTSGLLLTPEQVESARCLPLETLRQAILPLLSPLPPNAKSYALSAFDRKGLFLF